MRRTMRPTTVPSLLVLALAACTSLDAREPSQPLQQGHTADAKDTKGEIRPDPKPEPVASTVKIAIASVTLDQDCPDPEPPVSPARSIPASVAPSPSVAQPAKRSAAMPARPSDESAPEGYRRACPPSTLQLRFTNTGTAVAGIRIASINLHDVATKGVLAPVKSRLPAAFSDSGAYTPWDERLAAGAEFHASYRLTPPDWSMVESKLGGSTSRGREFELEVTLEIDGKPMTVRSPAFSRPPEIIMPPT